MRDDQLTVRDVWMRLIDVRYTIVSWPTWARGQLEGLPCALIYFLLGMSTPPRPHPAAQLIESLIIGVIVGSLFTVGTAREDRKVFATLGSKLTGQERALVVRSVDRDLSLPDPRLQQVAVNYAHHRLLPRRMWPTVLGTSVVGLFILLSFLIDAMLHGGGPWAGVFTIVWLVLVVAPMMSAWRDRRTARQFLATRGADVTSPAR